MTLRKTIKRFLANASTLLLAVTDRVDAEAKLIHFRQRRELVEGCANIIGRAFEIANPANCKSQRQGMNLGEQAPCAACASSPAHCPRAPRATQEHPNGPPDIEPIYQAPLGQTSEHKASNDGPLDMRDMDELYEIIGARPMPTVAEMARAWVAAQPA